MSKIEDMYVWILDPNDGVQSISGLTHVILKIYEQLYLTHFNSNN